MKRLRLKKRPQAGVAMLETALVMGFLVFLVLSCIDLYFLSSAYMTFSQIAREGVLTGNKLNQMLDWDLSGTDSGMTCSAGADVVLSNLQRPSSNYANCNPDVPHSCGHQLMQWRLEMALRMLSIYLFEVSTVTTKCIVLNPGDVNDRSKAVEVELIGQFRGMSPVFNGIPVKVRQRGLVS